MALRNLVPELLSGILYYLEKPDLKSIRLVCRYFEAVASPLLMDCVTLAPHFSSFNRCLKIFEHPVFSKSVKKITYDGAPHENITRSYFEIIGNQRSSSLYSGDMSSLERQQMGRGERDCQYTKYCQFAESWIKMRTEGLDYAYLHRALQSLPQLETVEVSDWSRSPLDSELYQDFPYLFWGDVADEVSHHALLTLIRALSHTNTRIKRFNLQAYFDTGYPAPVLRCDPGFPGSVFQMSSPDVQNFCNAFQSLRAVHLDLRIYHDRDIEGIKTGNLAKALTAAKGLENLSIIVGGKFSMQGPQIPFEAFVGKGNWSKLRSFRFDTSQCTDAQRSTLLSFLGSHSATLEFLYLRQIILAPGDWREIVENFRSWRVNAEVHFRKVWERDSEAKRLYYYETFPSLTMVVPG